MADFLTHLELGDIPSPDRDPIIQLLPKRMLDIDWIREIIVVELGKGRDVSGGNRGCHGMCEPSGQAWKRHTVV